MWRNLRGALRLVAVNGFSAETAPPKVKAVIARSCGMDDFGNLETAIDETASRATSHIEALYAISSPPLWQALSSHPPWTGELQT